MIALVIGIGAPARGELSVCERMAERAGRQEGVPENVLAAIARTESGGGPEAGGWPWTLNVQGQGAYFPNRGAALTRLTEALETGTRNVDVGCMQINFHWHGDQFASVEEMMDPMSNTAYAARYLAQLHEQFGSWEAAIRHYHSADPDRGAGYLARVHRMMDRLGEDTTVSVAVATDEIGIPPDTRFDSRPPLVVIDNRGGEQLASIAVQEGIPPRMPDEDTPNNSHVPDETRRGDLMERLRRNFMSSHTGSHSDR